MLTKVVVHERADYERWLAEASDFLSRMPPAEAGQLLYAQRGCRQCHSVDGGQGDRTDVQGSVRARPAARRGRRASRVDENYIRESILTPRAKVVAGFAPVMPSFQGRLRDEEIAAIIEYIKTLK